MMWITLCGYVDNYVKLFVLLCFGVWINVTEMLQVITELLQYCYVFVIIRMLWNCYELLQICYKCYKIVTISFDSHEPNTENIKPFLCTIYWTCLVGFVSGIVAIYIVLLYYSDNTSCTLTISIIYQNISYKNMESVTHALKPLENTVIFCSFL